MPMLLLWAAPAAIAFSGMGYYLIAVAELVDGAVALAPAATSPKRRPTFRVIQGGKFA
jgi:hypothetical protein